MYSTTRRAVLLAAALCTVLPLGQVRATDPPAWWSTGTPPVIDTGAAPDNHGVANLGQAKWIAKRALEALRDRAPSLADQVEADLVGTGKPIPTWDVPTTGSPEAKALRAPLLVGQLKAISAPFYERLDAFASAWLEDERVANGTNSSGSIYPWTSTTSDDANKAITNIGQVKAAFSLRFETLPVHAVRPGFETYTLAANDDGYTGLVPIGFDISLFGNTRDECYVNNNGNITFTGPLSTYTPYPLQNSALEIIAPFWADVDTRGTNSEILKYSYGTETINGHSAFGVNWINVGYFNAHDDKLNSFQLVLIERDDTGTGNFDIEFNYDTILWETGDASSGVNGYGGSPSRSGLSNGTNRTIELTHSGETLVQLDENPTTHVPNTTTGLRYRSRNSTVPGRFVFQVRSGEVLGALAVDAGPDQSLSSTVDTATLAGSASDPSSGSVTVHWSVLQGNPSEVTFSDVNSATPTINFTAGNSYTLQLTATSVSDPGISASDIMKINP